jgi:hypothetical protein
MSGDKRIASPLVIVSSEAHERAVREAGAVNVIVVDPLRGGDQIMLPAPSGAEQLRIGFSYEVRDRSAGRTRRVAR